MPQAFLTSGHVERSGQGEAQKLLVNAYSEASDLVPGQPAIIRSMPGIVDAAEGGPLTGPIHGLAYADGFAGGQLLIADGNVLRTFNGTHWGVIPGSLSGSGRVKFQFGEIQTAILSAGQITISSGSSVTPLTDSDWDGLLAAHGQNEFTDIVVAEQRLFALYGSQIAYSDAGNFDAIDGDHFYTAEYRPDKLVGGIYHGSEFVLFGTQSIQVCILSGYDKDPVTFLQDRRMPDLGALCRDAIVSFGSSIVFVDQDFNVRRMVGVDAPKLSRPWLSRLIKKVDPQRLVGEKFAIDGHYFYVLKSPDWTYALDMESGEWCQLKSYQSNTFDWSHILKQEGDVYLAEGSTLAKVDTGVYTQMGDPIVREGTAHNPKVPRGTSFSPIYTEGAYGVGPGNIELAISLDGGFAYTPYRARSLGGIGNYGDIALWNQCGRARTRNAVFKWRCSADVNFALSNMVFGERP